MWGNLAINPRTSTGNGATWSKARLISPERGIRNMPAESAIRTRVGYIVVPADAVTGGQGGTARHVSRDGERHGRTPADGRLIALGRGGNIDGRKPGEHLGRHGQDVNLLRRRVPAHRFGAAPGADAASRRSAAARDVRQGHAHHRRLGATLDAVVRPGVPRERQYIQMGIGTSGWRAYLPVCQTPDGVIHLISSRQHYDFNLAWLKKPGPAEPVPGN